MDRSVDTSKNWNDFETAFSVARVERYKAKCAGNAAQAMRAYQHNLRIAESLTPFFCTVEIALRNAMHKQLTAHFGRQDWWTVWASDPAHQGQIAHIQAASAKLRRRKEPATPDKIVAELPAVWAAWRQDEAGSAAAPKRAIEQRQLA